MLKKVGLNRMRDSKNLHNVLGFLLIFFITIYLYYLFYKPVEGFFAKSDACEVATRNRDFIQRQVNDVSANLVNLQSKLNQVTDIRTEIYRLLFNNNCLDFVTSNEPCKTIVNNYNQNEASLTKALADQKMNSDKLADLTGNLGALQANEAKNRDLIKRANDYLNIAKNCAESYFVDEKVGCCSILTAQRKRELCAQTLQLKRKAEDELNQLIEAPKQLPLLQANTTSLQDSVNRLKANKAKLQTDIDTNKCIRVKSSFLCLELEAQRKLLGTSIENGTFQQKSFLDFFKSKSTPLADINTLVSNSC